MSTPLKFLGSRRSGLALALTTLGLAASCGLSPVPVLPSANDGKDGSLDLDLDGISKGSGGSSSAGSGGAPPCTVETIYECRVHELWSVGPTAGCAVVETFLETCTHGCYTSADGVAECGLGGSAGAAGAAGSAGSGSDDER